MGLSTSHISPPPVPISRYIPKAQFKPGEPKLIMRLGGSLVKVKTGLRAVAGGGGTRGEVTGFSSAARLRLLRTIASVERQERPIFVTLTYPDVFDADMTRWKRDIDVFGKRLIRNFDAVGFIWRIEFKERKSGSSAGQMAPHFHLLLYGASLGSLRAWIPGAWWGVVRSGNKDHLTAGTSVERVRSFGGVMRYVGKYMAKVDTYPTGWSGKAWGIIGRRKLPWAVEVVINLTANETVKLVRMGRKMIKARGRTFPHGITWIVNAVRVLDYLEFLVAETE